MDLAGCLDAYMKLAIFQHELSRAGCDWMSVRQALQILNAWRCNAPEKMVRAALAEKHGDLSAAEQQRLHRLTRSGDVQKLGLEPLRFAVRLQGLELKFHELGGLFDQLDAAGLVDHVAVTPSEVQHAIHHAPPGGRAEVRGRCIIALSGIDSWQCEWQGVRNETDGTWYDIRDPFNAKCQPSPLEIDDFGLF